MSDKIYILSMPNANSDAMGNLVDSLAKLGDVGVPLYITSARVDPISKKDILKWAVTLIHISMKQGWTKELTEVVKKA